MGAACFRVLLAVLLFLGGVAPALAASFTVTPIRISLGPHQPTAAVHVRNNSDTPSVVQLQLRKWTQKRGKDEYAQTRDLIGTPPIFTIQPHAEQVVRVGLRLPPDARTERAYRMFLVEVPPPPKKGFEGLRFALRLALPVFVAPLAEAAPDLHWRAVRGGGSDLVLHVVNTGGAHAHISKIGVLQPGSGRRIGQSRGFYVLPGASRALHLKLGRPLVAGSRLELKVTTDSGTSRTEVVVGQ